MAMHRVPTLVLGIGGVGCRIAANISDLLTDEARERVGIVGMDTNVNDLTAVAARGVRTIQTSDERTVGEYLTHNPQHMPWFPLNAFTASKSLLNGAGQIRAVSRLGALATEERGGFIPIKEEIQRIRINRGDSSNGNLTVMIVGSITGGTGAGLFLQMPYYIRKLMADETGLKNIIIRGMFVGADLTEDVQPGPIQKAAVHVNAYACLKELNALYMRQLSSKKSNLSIDFYAPVSEEEKRSVMNKIHDAWSEFDSDYEDYSLEAISADAKIIAQGNPDVPYDYLYLIEGANSDGDTGHPPLGNVESLAARMVHTLMFTPVANNALSVEDNMILQDAAHKGMNRYSGAGMNRLIYPQDLAREYVTLCAVRDTVQSEWMVIDNGFQDVMTEALSRQKADGKVELPLLKNSYITLYDAEVGKDGSLRKLFSEAYYQDKNTDIRRSQQFVMAIEDMVANVLNEENVKNTAKACDLDMTKMGAFKTAPKEINRVYDALDTYEELAKALVSDRPAAIANKLFPPSWPSMRQSIEKPQHDFCDIYQLLHSVHPLTARFLCYDLIHSLEEMIADLDGIQSTVFDSYKKKDYDAVTPDIQTPTEAVNQIKDKQIPIIGSLISEERRLNNLTLLFKNDASKQKTLIKTYLESMLTLSVCKILLPRLEALAENYAIFFRSIGQMIAENQTRINSLENLTFPLGDTGVYCSKEAFQQIAAEYQNATNIGLTAETKSAIFENLFKVLADDLTSGVKVATERQKAARAAKKANALRKIFSSAVVDTIRTDVIKKGAEIVDMNVHEALKRQFELEAPERDDFPAYLQEQIRKAMKKASPMVATSANAAAENTATAYIAMHPDCAATELGEPDKDATQALFAPSASEETGNIKVAAMLDEAFSPQEIICFRARYKFSIEDLVKYSPASVNAARYHQRISRLGTAPVFTGDPDDGLTVINPHLNRYWHEEAFLPSIYKSEQSRNKLNLAKAFVCAMGLDYFVLEHDENTLDKDGNARLTWYYQTGRGYAPVRVRNGYIGNSFTDLYNALPFNGRTKARILKLIRWNMEERKGFTSAEELFETIMDDPFIDDLIQTKHTSSSKEEQNILDILLAMRSTMEHSEWDLLFTGLIEVLWEYCAYLFDQNERMVNISVRKILDAMVAHSSIAGKTEDEMSYGQKELHVQVENLRKLSYKKA